MELVRVLLHVTFLKVCALIRFRAKQFMGLRKSSKIISALLFGKTLIYPFLATNYCSFHEYETDRSSDVDQRIIPGCSAAEHGRDSPVLISNTMLQAYNKMRGPAAKDSQEDPLFEWIHLRDDICSGDGKTAQPRSRRDIFQ